MKDIVKIGALMERLPVVLRDAVHVALKSEGLNEDDVDVKRRSASADAQFEEGERAAVQYVSTHHIDRDNEVVVPSGIALNEFRLAPQVLVNHDYSELPIGSDDWIKPDEVGLLAKTRYSTIQRADDVFTLKQEGHLRTSSIGFVPLAWTMPGRNDWDKTLSQITSKWSDLAKGAANITRIITRSLLLEHSEVSVPANIHALTLAVAKGAVKLTDEMKQTIGIDTGEAAAVNAIKALLKNGTITPDEATKQIALLTFGVEPDKGKEKAPEKKQDPEQERIEISDKTLTALEKLEKSITLPVTPAASGEPVTLAGDIRVISEPRTIGKGGALGGVIHNAIDKARGRL